MFDTQDEIGLEDEDLKPKQTDSKNNDDDNVEGEKVETTLNEHSKIIIEGVNNSKSSKTNSTINVPNGEGNDQGNDQQTSSSSSSFMSYFDTFLSKK